MELTAKDLLAKIGELTMRLDYADAEIARLQAEAQARDQAPAAEPSG